MTVVSHAECMSYTFNFAAIHDIRLGHPILYLLTNGLKNIHVIESRLGICYVKIHGILLHGFEIKPN